MGASGQQFGIPKIVTLYIQVGTFQPILPIRPTKYEEMPLARPLEEIPYLKLRFQPTSQAGSSPNVAYVKANALPLTGNLELNSAYMTAVHKAISPEKRNPRHNEGPEYCTAMPVRANTPAPIVFPTPNMVSYPLVRIPCALF